MTTARKLRSELKFVCTEAMLKVIEHRLDSIAAIDSHASKDKSYVVSSLYFDNYSDGSCHDNDLGIDRRFKFRIRHYNGKTDIMKLEKKHKINDKGIKTHCTLPLSEYQRLYTGEVSSLLYQETNPVLKEFCTRINNQQFRPKIIVQYERKAFISFAGNVRITLDLNCSASYQTERFLSNDMMKFPLQEKGLHLLEVKFDEFLPDHIKQALQLDMLRQTTYSKYYMSRKTIQNYWR